MVGQQKFVIEVSRESFVHLGHQKAKRFLASEELIERGEMDSFHPLLQYLVGKSTEIGGGST
jgi:hypothetical protein